MMNMAAGQAPQQYLFWRRDNFLILLTTCVMYAIRLFSVALVNIFNLIAQDKPPDVKY